MGDLSSAELLHLVLSKLLSGSDLHPGHDLLAVLGIRQANDLYVADLRVGIEEFLDLTGIDVLTAANDHVLDTPNNIDIAINIHCRQVAGMHPVGLIDSTSRLLRIIPVAQHNAIASCAELTRLANRDDLTRLRINNFDLNMRMNSANAADTFLEWGIDTGLC